MERMNEDKVSDVEVFVHKKLVVAFACPQCNLEKSIEVEKIKDVSHWKVNATCRRCAHKFRVSFNFRKYYRKEIFLHGLLFADLATLDPIGDARLTDVSLTGIGFECAGWKPKVGDVAIIRFLLDDEDNSEVEKRISIESIRGSKIGAAFMDTKGFDKVLGRYILPK
jgi:hypothetical protein